MTHLALRSTELPIFIVGIVFFFIYLVVRVSARERENRRRLELIEKALDSGTIDERTKRELVEAVAKKPLGRAREGVHPVFTLGWIGLFAGIGMVIVALGEERWWRPAVMTTAISFGVLSVPMAVRELQSRKEHA